MILTRASFRFFLMTVALSREDLPSGREARTFVATDLIAARSASRVLATEVPLGPTWRRKLPTALSSGVDSCEEPLRDLWITVFFYKR
jgi:hypothetical protein